MSDYIITINGEYFEVNGTEAAYEAFQLALSFGEMVNANVALVDGYTGEILEDNYDD